MKIEKKQILNADPLSQQSKKKDKKAKNEKDSEIKVHYFLVTSVLYNDQYKLKILIEMKNIKKSSNFMKEGTIPSEWYVTSLLEYLKKIPKNLTENDCEELYKDIENDLKKSIKDLDFGALSEIIGKLKFATAYKVYYEESKRLLIDIKLNHESKSIIENVFIPVDVIFNLDEDSESGIFEINASNFKEKDKNNIEKIKDYEKKERKKIQNYV